MSVTLADLSKRSGYSQATVSRVVNGVEGVSAEVQAEVERAIRELGYVARRPRGAEAARTIEVILHRSSPLERLEVGPAGVAVGPLTAAAPATLLTGPWQLSNDFYRHLLDGILDELGQRGHKALLQVANDLADPVLLAGAAEGGGLLLVGEGGAGVAGFVAACRRPLVLVDMLLPGGPDQVTTDNLGGIGQAVRHLVELGHRELGFVGGPEAPLPRERADAFAYHVVRAGLRSPAEWTVMCDTDSESTAAAVDQLLARRHRPGALVCGNDFTALTVVRAAARRGLRVPQDLSVVGFDDNGFASLVTPALTTVRTASAGIGRQAVRQLLSRRVPAARDEPGCVVRLPTALVVRGSTARRR
jgi:LacI family transcriptional regulator